MQYFLSGSLDKCHKICLFSFRGPAQDLSIICLNVFLAITAICWYTEFAYLQFTTLGQGEGKGCRTMLFPKTSKLQLQTQIKAL